MKLRVWSSQRIFLTLLTIFGFIFLECECNVICPEPLQALVENHGCDSIKCISSFSNANCSKDSVYEENLTFCGCCPGCAKYQGHVTGKCEVNFDNAKLQYEDCGSLYCPVIKNCKAGLICSDGTCSLPQPPYPTCQGRCPLQKAAAEMYGNWNWTPNCTEDGYYRPLQKKGTRASGDCFCVDECGNRILGRMRRSAANGDCAEQTCGCSRHVHKLRKQEGRIATLHCTDEGNYEPLQCDTDSSLCYCVDPKSGRVMGDVLPEHQWKDLPCYDSKAPHFANEGNYLRRCESENAPGQKLGREASLHGLTFSTREVDCDYDGSYKPMFRDRSLIKELCVDKAGTQILTYFRQLRDLDDMDCHCARDILFFASLGIPFTKTCSDIGNYQPYYHIGNYVQCADADGYLFGPQVPSDYACCLELVDGSHTCGDEQSSNLCNTIYKKCTDYLFARK